MSIDLIQIKRDGCGTLESFVCVSINYKRCGEEIRGEFTPEPARRADFITLHSEFSPVLLCTCCRTELYITGTPDKAVWLLSELSGVPEGRVRSCSMQFDGEGAVRHLFRVASGIDSAIVGEDEVLGQLKNAFAFSAERIRLSDRTNIIFQSAVTTAKRIKTQTALSKTSVSHATLAAKMAAHSAAEPLVMLIGASGNTGTSLLKNLLSYRNVRVLATMRSHSGAVVLPDSPALTVIPYERRYEYISGCDCVVSATTSPHTVISAERLEAPGKPQLFIDLAIPRDIDPATAEISGITLRSVDYFQELAAGNDQLKQDSVEQAKQMITEDIDELKKTLLMHDIQPELRSTGVLSGMTAEELFYKLRSGLDSHAFGAVVETVRELGGK